MIGQHIIKSRRCLSLKSVKNSQEYLRVNEEKRALLMYESVSHFVKIYLNENRQTNKLILIAAVFLRESLVLSIGHFRVPKTL